MAPGIIPHHGYSPSCGNFGVIVVQKKSELKSTIKVEYEEWTDSDDAFHTASIQWDGEELSVADAEELLGAADVPEYIQDVCAIDMVIRCVEATLKERKEDESKRSTALPSILVRVSTDKETYDLEAVENELFQDDNV